MVVGEYFEFFIDGGYQMNSNNASLAMQRIAKLVDENSFMEIGSLVTARSTDFNLTAKKAPSDGVIIGHGLVEGNLVFIYSQDSSVLNGTIGEMHAKKIASVYDMAIKMGAPVIGLIDCAGIRLQESVDALDGFGQIYAKEVSASGVIPQISAIFGSCGGGLSVVPALSDFAFVEESKGRMFVNSPDAISGNRVEKCDTASAKFQSEENGCIDGVGTEDEILAQIRDLVCMLPSNNEGDVYTSDCEDDLNRTCNSMDTMLGDPRYVLSELSDDHIFFETKKNYAKNMVTGFVKLNGMTVGAVANCTEVYDEEGNKTETFAPALTARGCNKAAEFVNFCDAFSIPVLTLTNVKDFAATKCSEKNLAKAMARMTSAFASTTSAKVNLITGAAYGSPYVAMNSKSIGADLVYAWPDAKIGMMDSDLAVKIMYPEADAKELAEKAKEYEQLQSSAVSAAARGYVDLIFDAADTRKYLVAAFEMLYSKYEGEPEKKHGTK
jgi:acetyl-CoA carboxylase carboxyltransferase component